MKSNETIYNYTNLQDKNEFNYAFPLRHTCLQRSLRISLFGIWVGQTVSVANHVIYSRDHLQLNGTIFL